MLEHLQEHGQITNWECQRACGLTSRQAGYGLACMAQAGKLVQVGQKRWTYYRLPDA